MANTNNVLLKNIQAAEYVAVVPTTPFEWQSILMTATNWWLLSGRVYIYAWWGWRKLITDQDDLTIWAIQIVWWYDASWDTFPTTWTWPAWAIAEWDLFFITVAWTLWTKEVKVWDAIIAKIDSADAEAEYIFLWSIINLTWFSKTEYVAFAPDWTGGATESIVHNLWLAWARVVNITDSNWDTMKFKYTNTDNNTILATNELWDMPDLSLWSYIATITAKVV